MKKILLLLVILLSVSNAFAQKMEVVSFECKLNDLDAQRFPKYYGDENQTCALVKVRLARPNAKFEDGYIMDEPEFKTNEYWVYMAEGAKKFTIHLDGFPTLDVDFGEKLQSKGTYILTVSTDDKIYLKKNSFYFGGSYSIGSFSGVAGHIGATWNNIDAQLSYTFGLSQKGPVNFYNSNDGSFLCKNNYSLNEFAAKIGYQFTLASHFGIVPQVGFAYQSLTCHVIEGAEGKGGGASCNSILVGGKFMYSPWKHISLFVSPEYGISIKQDAMFDVVSRSADFNASGFYCNIGILAYF